MRPVAHIAFFATLASLAIGYASSATQSEGLRVSASVEPFVTMSLRPLPSIGALNTGWGRAYALEVATNLKEWINVVASKGALSVPTEITVAIRGSAEDLRNGVRRFAKDSPAIIAGGPTTIYSVTGPEKADGIADAVLVVRVAGFAGNAHELDDTVSLFVVPNF